jgi:hypothetical protein
MPYKQQTQTVKQARASITAGTKSASHSAVLVAGTHTVQRHTLTLIGCHGHHLFSKTKRSLSKMHHQSQRQQLHHWLHTSEEMDI